VFLHPAGLLTITGFNRSNSPGCKEKLPGELSLPVSSILLFSRMIPTQKDDVVYLNPITNKLYE
jgi:hypothetical protein